MDRNLRTVTASMRSFSHTNLERLVTQVYRLLFATKNIRSLTPEHLFYYNLPHVYLAQIVVRDRLASHIRPSQISGQ